MLYKKEKEINLKFDWFFSNWTTELFTIKFALVVIVSIALFDVEFSVSVVIVRYTIHLLTFSGTASLAEH